jgi:hypothetical protein
VSSLLASINIIIKELFNVSKIGQVHWISFKSSFWSYSDQQVAPPAKGFEPRIAKGSLVLRLVEGKTQAPLGVGQIGAKEQAWAPSTVEATFDTLLEVC